MDVQSIDPKSAALKMVVYKALSGFIMVAIYSVFEIATIYIYHWLAVPSQVQAMPT